MDSRRFDDLARSLAAGRSRRNVLRGFIGALAGLVGGVTATRSVGAAACTVDDECDPDWSCVGGVCTPETCGGREFDSCGEKPCCWGYYCISDGLYCVQSACQVDDDCNVIFFDTQPPCINGVCVGRLSEIGEPCETDVHCDGGWCSAGICTVQFAEGDPCTANDQCDTGRCIDSICFHACTRKGHTCHADIDCCDELVCTDEMCAVPSDTPTEVVETPDPGDTGGATPVDDPGTVTEPTPSPEVGGVPVALPNTGSGSQAAPNHHVLIGTGVAAAAAVIARALANRSKSPAEDVGD